MDNTHNDYPLGYIEKDIKSPMKFETLIKVLETAEREEEYLSLCHLLPGMENNQHKIFYQDNN